MDCLTPFSHLKQRMCFPFHDLATIFLHLTFHFCERSPFCLSRPPSWNFLCAEEMRNAKQGNHLKTVIWDDLSLWYVPAKKNHIHVTQCDLTLWHVAVTSHRSRCITGKACDWSIYGVVARACYTRRLNVCVTFFHSVTKGPVTQGDLSWGQVTSCDRTSFTDTCTCTV